MDDHIWRWKHGRNSCGNNTNGGRVGNGGASFTRRTKCNDAQLFRTRALKPKKLYRNSLRLDSMDPVYDVSEPKWVLQWWMANESSSKVIKSWHNLQCNHILSSSRRRNSFNCSGHWLHAFLISPSYYCLPLPSQPMLLHSDSHMYGSHTWKSLRYVSWIDIWQLASSLHNYHSRC